MEKIYPENQIILFEAIRKYYPQSENKEILLPMIFQWFNERSSQFIPASELKEICCTLYDFSSKHSKIGEQKVIHPFQFKYV